MVLEVYQQKSVSRVQFLNFLNENIKTSFNNPTSVANLPFFIIKQMALLVVSINNIGQ